ncbi:hypothetical protein [uncultured Photobacterium sp.]|uniref:hypothetical protein n=1 Tax=uncultured Photobacterium sp. TaxID=173973 RepID=UPI00262EDD56|nr:hypothetical protein [uncultured Photobacterium sp.]
MIFNPARLKLLHEQLRQNHQTAFVLSEEQVVELAKNKGVPLAKLLGGNAATALDLKTLTKLVRELGFTGRIIQKRVSGKTYIIFKGYPGLRSIFMGTRYLATNGKVMDMAIGTTALKNSALSGFRLTLFFTVPLVVVEHLFKDKVLLPYFQLPQELLWGQ